MILRGTKIFLIVFTFLFLSSVQAETLFFEDDELPGESVVPLLDSSMAVKGKAIPFSGRLEMGVMAATIIDEMFFNSTLLGFQAFYAVNEENMWGLKYLDRVSGQSTYADQFSSSSSHLDFTKAPAPGSVIAGSYRWNFLYGKMSFSKDFVLPTVFSTEFDFGVNKWGSETLPLLALGLMQKLYFKKRIGLGFSYRLLAYQILDPVSKDIGNAAPPPSESAFEKKIQVSQSLDLSLSFLF